MRVSAHSISAGLLLCSLVFPCRGSTSPDSIADTAMGTLNLEAAPQVAVDKSGAAQLYGSLRTTVRQHRYADYPLYIRDDRGWTVADGPELELRMRIKPDRHCLFWSGLVLKSALPGGMVPNLLSDRSPSGFRDVTGRHYSDQQGNLENILLYQDVTAGMQLQLGQATFLARLGGILWLQSSPLTLWTADTRHFAWDYLPFEDEKGVSRYYYERVIAGQDNGPASDRWSKRPLQGISVEAVSLPAHIDCKFAVGQFAAPDFFEREALTFDNLRERWMVAGRLSWNSQVVTRRDLEMGFNYAGAYYDNDVVRSSEFRNRFGIKAGDTTVQHGFYKPWHVFSLDSRGQLAGALAIHSELAVSRLDTHSVKISPDSTTTAVTTGALRPAFYSIMRTEHGLPLEAEMVYLDGRFYSPASSVLPANLAFPTGSNLYGMAKMLNGAVYTSNHAGARLAYIPSGRFGKLKLRYGQFAQLVPGPDVLHFPHRLNGSDFQQSFQTSWSRWTSRPIDRSLSNAYDKRIGDESYSYAFEQTPGIDAGGIRGEYLTAFESFVPFENEAQANASVNCTTSISTRSPFIPAHRKWSSELSMDAGLDLSSMLGSHRALLLDCHLAVNGVSARPVVLKLDESGMMLWGFHARLEPSFALTPSLYMLLLAGFENWRSDMAYMEVKETLTDAARRTARVPIDFRDYAAGAGFDWDLARRMGLHVRYKWMVHNDIRFAANNWTSSGLAATLKSWF